MSEQPEPPRVTVALPGGGRVAGRLLRWRQDREGRWWGEIALYTPAGAVQQVPGEDYTHVPREPAGPPYVIATDTRVTPPAGEIHRADCWTISQPATWRRITPFLPGTDPEAMARFDDTTLCTICMPPGQE